MTWTSTIKATGSGTIRAAIVIEGWPDMWACDRSITWAPDSQTVKYGLSLDGIAIRDRVILQHAICEQDGITFRINPAEYRPQGVTQWDDDATASFSRRVEPMAAAVEDLAAGATTMPDLVNSRTLADNTTYYMGSEAIRVGTWPTITSRGHFSSIDQTHFVPTDPLSDATLFVWGYPPTMEGRRVYLYVWGDGETGASAGTLVWRGIVRRPPVLPAGGTSWQIPCGPITDVLKQQLAGDIKVAHPVGIYHHASCSIRLDMAFSDVGVNDLDTTMIVGWDATETEMLDRINDAVATALVATGADAFVESLLCARGTNGNFRLELRTKSSGADFILVRLSSPIIGGCHSGKDLWTDAATGDPAQGHIVALDVSTTYYIELQRPHPFFFDGNFLEVLGEMANPLEAVAPLGEAHTIMYNIDGIQLRGQHWQTDDATDKLNNPPWRLYVDADMSGAEAVIIPGTGKPDGLFTINNTGSNGHGYFVDIDPVVLNIGTLLPLAGNPAEGFMGFVDATAEIRVRRNYGVGINVFAFINAVQTMAPLFGNKADTPFLTDSDCTTWAAASGSLHGPQATVAARDFVFYGPVALDVMLQEELKLICCFMRISEDGRIDAVPMPALTPSSPVSGENIIDGSDIITPADGKGAWPTWEPQRDGRITTVKYQTEYDSISDSWLDEPKIFMDGSAISLSKTRGKAESSIKPYSRPSTHVAQIFAALGGSSVPDVGDVAKRYLALFARDYDVVEVCVPFTKFDILCGDIVSLTHGHIPDGTGKRGLVGRRGVVIERYWPLDPQQQVYGRLKILLVQENAVVGYAPSAAITAVPVEGDPDVWSLEFDPANDINIWWSTNSDGLVLQHFQDGDYIRIVEWDSFTPTIVTGGISNVDVDAGTCTVTLNEAWVPGGGSWIMEYQSNPTGTTASATQEQYAYVADADQLLSDDSTYARRFA